MIDIKYHNFFFSIRENHMAVRMDGYYFKGFRGILFQVIEVEEEKNDKYINFCFFRSGGNNIPQIFVGIYLASW